MQLIVRLAVTCTGLYTVTGNRKTFASVEASLTTELSQSNKDHNLEKHRNEQTYIMAVPSAQASNQPTYLTSYAHEQMYRSSAQSYTQAFLNRLHSQKYLLRPHIMTMHGPNYRLHVHWVIAEH